MTLTIFRNHFPEFTNTTNWTDGQINFYLALADKMLLENRWNDIKPYGVELFVAHNIVLAKSSFDSSNAGGLPGMLSGPTNSKAVGSVSISYDTQAGIEKDAGHWNLTTYGKQFIHLARMMGAGAVQL